MILIHPPVVKPCEPPAGPAKLAGAMHDHDIPCKIIDANVEGVLSLLSEMGMGEHYPEMQIGDRSKEAIPKNLFSTWTNRSFRYLGSNITALTSWETYKNIDRYKRAVIDIDRVLEVAASKSGAHLSLANYLDRSLSPVRSADLIRASEIPEQNPFYGYFKKRLGAVLEQEYPAAVGFSLNYLSQALSTFAMIGFLKRECPGIRVVLGGGLVTSWMRRPGWSNPFGSLVDDLVAGPGEAALLSIYGTACRQGHHTPHYGVSSMSNYLAPGPVLPYSASSGCYWNRCSFCPERAEGSPYEPIPTDRVIEDISSLAERTKPALIHLLDNAVSPALLKAIVGSSFSFPWYGFAKVSSHLTDLDFCRALKRSGCVMLQLGLESGDQDVLDSMQKGFDLMTASAALKTLKKAGIATYIYLIFGTPWETIVEARKTLDFAIRHSAEIDFLNLAIFNLPAYSPEARELDVTDFYEGDLALYRNFLHPKGWKRSLVRQFLDREFKKNPALAPILRKAPPVFTSNHAPFFMMKTR
ncbi:MAG: B12-binding domain-containing radical SAM protein [Syntrophales bacterium]